MPSPFPLRPLQFDMSLCRAEGGTPHKIVECFFASHTEHCKGEGNYYIFESWM